jgi:ClpP class serine protease
MAVERGNRDACILFRERIKKSRGIKDNSIFQGQVFLAKDALSLNLVDDLGGLIALWDFLFIAFDHQLYSIKFAWRF